MLEHVSNLRVKLKDGVAFLGARASNPTLWLVSQDVRTEGHRIVTLHCRRKESSYGLRSALVLITPERWRRSVSRLQGASGQSHRHSIHSVQSAPSLCLAIQLRPFASVPVICTCVNGHHLPMLIGPAHRQPKRCLTPSHLVYL
ncbi:hypothetical protein DNTS_007071 [Danionella cerebrum]|uniref:Transmembrane protein TMEM132 cohesin-like domain-containing protein n=1 Tax=Danionella cerebrum TaxID=2873325 RepID=A0A553N371_9TELE|nr:hypothetical protein DNTS_007071 [Danionella translucida]